jgi:hypothetical protein
MGWASVKGESCARALSGDRQGGGSPISELGWRAGLRLGSNGCPSGVGSGARSSPEAVQRCAEGAGLDGADEAHAILVRSNPHPVQGAASAPSQSSRPKPVFRHAAATAASPHIRSARQAPRNHNPSCTRASGSEEWDHPF